MQDKIEIIKQRFKNKQVFKGISKEKSIIGILLLLLVGFLLYQSLLASQFLRLKAIDFQFNSLKGLSNSYNWLTGHTDVLVNEAKEAEAKLTHIRTRFISEEELPDYFANFRNLVKSHNLQVVSLDFKPQKEVLDSRGRPLEYFKALPLDISIKGDYLNTLFLVYKLERGAPIFDIKEVRIRQEAADSYEVILDLGSAIYILRRRF